MRILLTYTLIIGLLGLLSSCQSLSPSRDDMRPTPGSVVVSGLTEHTKRICLDSEGRGRINQSSGRGGFAFEALLHEDQNEWILGINVPLHPMGVARFNYRTGRVITSELASPFQKTWKHPSSVPMKLLLQTLLDPKQENLQCSALKEGTEGSCLYSGTPYKGFWHFDEGSGQFEIQIKGRKDEEQTVLSFLASRLEAGRYRLMELTLAPRGEDGKSLVAAHFTQIQFRISKCL